jgi:hypothetical protein
MGGKETYIKLLQVEYETDQDNAEEKETPQVIGLAPLHNEHKGFAIKPPCLLQRFTPRFHDLL